MYDIISRFLRDVFVPTTANAVVNAGTKLSARPPSTAVCRFDGVQYRVLVLSSLMQETLTPV